MQKIEFVGSHQYCSPFAISITSSGRETVRPAASGGRNPSSHAIGCNETGHGVDTGARPPPQPETLWHGAPRRHRVKGLNLAKVAKVANISGTRRYEFFNGTGSRRNQCPGAVVLCRIAASTPDAESSRWQFGASLPRG